MNSLHAQNLYYLYGCFLIVYRNGIKSISMFFRVNPISLLTTRLVTQRNKTIDAIAENVQNHEVGVINLTKFSHGDTSFGYLQLDISLQVLNDVSTVSSSRRDGIPPPVDRVQLWSGRKYNQSRTQ